MSNIRKRDHETYDEITYTRWKGGGHIRTTIGNETKLPSCGFQWYLVILVSIHPIQLTHVFVRNLFYRRICHVAFTLSRYNAHLCNHPPKIDRTLVIIEFLLQHHNSNSQKVILKHVTLDSTGVYKCEVSAEAPSFLSVKGKGYMEVIGE